MANIILRTNPEKFSNLSEWNIREVIEHSIEIAKRKYFRSSVPKTKAQALVEEMEGYHARNCQYNRNICDFNTYAQHWIEAHRGVIPDLYLDILEIKFGRLQGQLNVARGHSSWDTRRDFRGDARPNIHSAGGTNA